MLSAPLVSSVIPSGTSCSSFATFLVKSPKSSDLVNSTLRFVSIVLQHVSISSLAVPMANAGSRSMAFYRLCAPCRTPPFADSKNLPRMPLIGCTDASVN